MTSLVIGASAGLGRALAEALARQGQDLFLVASDEKDLIPAANDLSLRYDVRVAWLASDLRKMDAAGLCAAFFKKFDGLDSLFIIAGWGDPNADSGAVSQELADDLIEINFRAPISIINVFLDHLSMRPGTNIVGAGSVAAVRGRRINSIYASCKKGLGFYFECLRHYLSDTPCRVQFYHLGYLATQMTFGKRLLFPAANPTLIAEKIIAGLGRDRARYLPSWWAPIALILKSLPWPVFKLLRM